MGPSDHVLDGGSDPPMGRGKFLGENGRPMLANTIEPSVSGGDAVLCQITLTTCLVLVNVIVNLNAIDRSVSVIALWRPRPAMLHVVCLDTHC